MSELEKFVKVEMIRDVPLESIVDLMDKLEAEVRELRAKVELLPTVSQYNNGFCTSRICIEGIYFGYVDGAWLKADDQLLAKQRYELGLEQPTKGDGDE